MVRPPVGRIESSDCDVFTLSLPDVCSLAYITRRARNSQHLHDPVKRLGELVCVVVGGGPPASDKPISIFLQHKAYRRRNEATEVLVYRRKSLGALRTPLSHVLSPYQYFSPLLHDHTLAGDKHSSGPAIPRRGECRLYLGPGLIPQAKDPPSLKKLAEGKPAYYDAAVCLKGGTAPSNFHITNVRQQ